LAKIAVESAGDLERRRATAPRLVSRLLAEADDWTVADLVCNAGPQDRPFEEQHAQVSIALVLAGTFQYRAAGGRRGAGELMTPGSVLLGNAGAPFECGHEHGVGDRCLSFHFAPEYFQRIAADAGVGPGNRVFPVPRLPALRALSPLLARALAALRDDRGGVNGWSSEVSWEELGLELAARTSRLASHAGEDRREALPSALARVTRAIRTIEECREANPTVSLLAREARLSSYHFLRTFRQLTGLTPHQYVRRVRLREAAARLVAERAKVLDIALDSGFGDVSNFNHAFRSEFEMSPREFRRVRSGVILSPSLVILSAAKNLGSALRINSAKDLCSCP